MEGGGHIKIKKVSLNANDYIMHIISNMDNTITAKEVDIYISNFLTYEIINEREAKLLKVATSDNILRVPYEIKDTLRANIFRNMILNLI